MFFASILSVSLIFCETLQALTVPAEKIESTSTTGAITTHNVLAEKTTAMVKRQPSNTRSRFNRIYISYHCPIGGQATRHFDLGVVYESDEIYWKQYTNVDRIDYRSRENHHPIIAKAVFYHDGCPTEQRSDAVCTYHFEGHLNADIYTHFVSLEMVEDTSPENPRRPIVRETCLDMTRRPRSNGVCTVPIAAASCTISDITYVAFMPPHH